jgi:ubiquinone/menaquinone biosynthesis C-methylase UbiE
VAEEVRNPFFARFYHRVLSREGPRMEAMRRRLLDGLAGRVVEVGAGDGRNFALYPSQVEEVVAVEPEPYMRARAAERARGAVRVVDGTAERLPVEDGSADAVICCYVLCSVAEPAAALAEARRVLRPGGELRLFEHVGADGGLMRLAQRAVEATFWPRAFGNCHPTRDTLAAVRGAGFDVSDVERFAFTPGPTQPPIPHILGAAVGEPRR